MKSMKMISMRCSSRNWLVYFWSTWSLECWSSFLERVLTVTNSESDTFQAFSPSHLKYILGCVTLRSLDYAVRWILFSNIHISLGYSALNKPFLGKNLPPVAKKREMFVSRTWSRISGSGTGAHSGNFPRKLLSLSLLSPRWSESTQQLTGRSLIHHNTRDKMYPIVQLSIALMMEMTKLKYNILWPAQVKTKSCSLDNKCSLFTTPT